MRSLALFAGVLPFSWQKGTNRHDSFEISLYYFGDECAMSHLAKSILKSWEMLYRELTGYRYIDGEFFIQYFTVVFLNQEFNTIKMGIWESEHHRVGRNLLS